MDNEAIKDLRKQRELTEKKFVSDFLEKEIKPAFDSALANIQMKIRMR
jgi:hypothetical protein